MKRILLVLICTMMLTSFGFAKGTDDEVMGHPDDSPLACAYYITANQKHVGYRDMIYPVLSNLYANRNQSDQALYLLNAIQDEESKDFAIVCVIGGLSANGQYDRANSLLNQMKDPYFKSYTLSLMARCYAQDKNEKSAVQCLEKAVTLGWVIKTIEESDEQLDMNMNLENEMSRKFRALVEAADVYMSTNKNGEAKKILDETTAFFEEIDFGCAGFKGSFLAQIALRYHSLGEHQKSITLLKEAENLARVKDGWLNAEEQLLPEFAECYAQIGEYQTAIKLLNSIREKIHLGAKFKYKKKITEELYLANRKKEASKLLKELVILFRQEKDLYQKIIIGSDLSITAWNIGQHEISRKLLDEASELLKRNKDQSDCYPELAIEISEKYRLLGDEATSLGLLSEALEEYQVVRCQKLEEPQTSDEDYKYKWIDYNIEKDRPDNIAQELIVEYAEHGMVVEALKLVKDINDLEKRALSLIEIGKRVNRALTDEEKNCLREITESNKDN